MIDGLLPEQLSLLSAAVLVVASFCTSALTAAAGVGGGLAMLALMTYLIPVHALIAVHGLVQLGSNASRTWVQRADINWRVARIFLLGSVTGAILGVLIAVQLPSGFLQVLLGLFIITMIWIRFPALQNAAGLTIATGGSVTTFISMFTGATGPLVAVFLKNIFEKHREMVATHAATMMAQHGVKVAAFAFAGFVFYHWLPLVTAMVISGFLGVKAGTLVMNRMPERALQILFRSVLTLVALDLVRRGIQITLQGSS